MRVSRLGRAPRSLVVVVVAGALAAAGLSATGAGASTATKSAKSPLGTPQKAKGEAVTVGFVSDGHASALDLSAEFDAAKAAANYANNYLNGVAGGHVLKLLTCETKATAAGARDCASQMANAKVPVVLTAQSSVDNDLADGILKAGIPYMTKGSVQTNVLTSPGAYSLANGLATTLSGPAAIAQENKSKHVGLLLIDVPAATGAANALAKAFYANAGAELDIVPIPPGTADMTPQVQAELAKNPDQITLVFDTAGCISAVKALKTLGFKGKIVTNPECIDSTFVDAVKALPGGLAGISTATAVDLDPKNKEFKVYKAAMAKWAKGVTVGGTNANVWQAVIGFVRAMQNATFPLTPESVKATLAAMPATPLPLGGGMQFQCDGKQVKIAPNICTNYVLLTTLDKNGKNSSYKAFDTTAIATLPG